MWQACPVGIPDACASLDYHVPQLHWWTAMHSDLLLLLYQVSSLNLCVLFCWPHSLLDHLKGDFGGIYFIFILSGPIISIIMCQLPDSSVSDIPLTNTECVSDPLSPVLRLPALWTTLLTNTTSSRRWPLTSSASMTKKDRSMTYECNFSCELGLVFAGTKL